MIVHPESRSVLLRVRDPEIIRKCLPGQTKPIDYKQHNIRIKHSLDATKILCNMGIAVPSPIRYYYNFPRPAYIKQPFEHQYVTSSFLTLHKRCFVLNEMGTSKTACALWSADYLMKVGVVKKALVIAPLSTLERVWLDEAFNFIMKRKAVVLHGKAERRLELLATDADIYIINYEGLEIIANEVAKREDINLIIVDEAAAYRNHTNQRYHVLKNLLQPRHRLWMMTGTPCPNAPTDAWALAKLVSPDRVPVYFTTFKRDTMQQVSMYKWVPRIGSHETAFSALHPAIRFRKKDCLDLPPVTFEKRQVELTPEQIKAYRQMKLYMATEAKKTTITAVHAGDQLGKLRQILCGAVKDKDTGQYLELPHAPRTKVLLECIEQAAAKVIVIVPYKGITQALERDVTKYLTPFGTTCAIVNGDVSPSMRNKIFHRFQHEESLRVLLCHPKVMAHGLNLVQADMIVFYAPIYSNEESQQVMERINRPGQTRNMTIVRLGATPLEWDIYAVVEGRRLTQESLLELYRKELQS